MTQGRAPRPAELASIRVLLVHDWLVTWAGSERVLEQLLHVFPGADVIVGVRSPRLQMSSPAARRARETWMRFLPFARRHHRWFLPIYPAAFATIDTRGYDLVISSAHAFAKLVRAPAGVPHLCYCHSPPRYLWDLQETYQRDAGAAGLGLRALAPLLRHLDRAGGRRVTRFVANSQYIASRIRRAYDREAAVVYPPVTAKPSSVAPGPRTNTLLALGRLVPYKRVDLAIEAANVLGRDLIVAGDGPERSRLERLAGETVRFVGEVTEEEAGLLLERCSALVFCAEEDFGITPVEANAHGMPVVAFGKGGVLESVIDGLSGVFFQAQTVHSVADAIVRLSQREWDDAAIRANAARFSAERFREGIRDQVALLFAGQREE